jgi:adenine C2-methylase RlmN of 23S rRNA A2503 and tRNA A37
MAGVFGPEIDSRADFLNRLDEAGKLASSMVASRPNDKTLNVVRNQLDAVAQWSANGRAPTLEERNRIDMGYRMYREYDDDPDPEVQRLEELAKVLSNYVRYWPDDRTASDPKNGDYLLSS